MENLLGYCLDDFQGQAIALGYTIQDIQYLNGQPGLPRVVRIKAQGKNLHILVAYERRLLD